MASFNRRYVLTSSASRFERISNRNLLDFYRKELEEGRWQDIPPNAWRRLKDLDAVHVRRTGRRKLIITLRT